MVKEKIYREKVFERILEAFVILKVLNRTHH